jgi:hypothetical protein
MYITLKNIVIRKKNKIFYLKILYIFKKFKEILAKHTKANLNDYKEDSVVYSQVYDIS